MATRNWIGLLSPGDGDNLTEELERGYEAALLMGSRSSSRGGRLEEHVPSGSFDQLDALACWTHELMRA